MVRNRKSFKGVIAYVAIVDLAGAMILVHVEFEAMLSSCRANSITQSVRSLYQGAPPTPYSILLDRKSYFPYRIPHPSFINHATNRNLLLMHLQAYVIDEMLATQARGNLFLCVHTNGALGVVVRSLAFAEGNVRGALTILMIYQWTRLKR